jgi:hypothetical protein
MIRGAWHIVQDGSTVLTPERICTWAIQLGERWGDVSSLILVLAEESKASASERVSSPSNGFFFVISCNPTFWRDCAGEFLIHPPYGMREEGNVAQAPRQAEARTWQGRHVHFREKMKWEARHSKREQNRYPRNN